MLDGIIDNDMTFYTFDDFVKMRNYIKDKMHTKEFSYLVVYRMYVESRPWIKDFYRGCIWDFLNDYMTDSELMDKYNDYLYKYGDKHE
jgi:hypothetical protein